MKTGDVVRGIVDDNQDESENENENGEAEENATVLCDAAGNDKLCPAIVKGHLSRGELRKLQHEHNGKRSGGDKSGDMPIKYP